MKVSFVWIVALFMFVIGCSGQQDGSFQTKAKNLSGAKSADGQEQYVFNAADFENGKPQYFSVVHNGKAVRFFLVRANDGVVRAAFDACDVCHRAKKGYILQNNTMLCVNCGMRFPLDRINYVTGGCNPSALARIFEGDKIVIYKKDIIEGEIYF